MLPLSHKRVDPTGNMQYLLREKRSVIVAKRCEESVNDDLIDVLLKLQQTGELEFNVPSNHIKAVTLGFFFFFLVNEQFFTNSFTRILLLHKVVNDLRYVSMYFATPYSFEW